MKDTDFRKIISNNNYICRYIFKYVPIYAVCKIIMQLLNAVISVVTYTYSLKFIIDSIQYKRPFTETLFILVLLAFANIIIRTMDAFFEYVITPVSRERLKQKLQLELFTNAVKMDLSCYDDPEFYNDFILAASQAEDQCFEIYNTIMELIKCIFSIISLSVIILSVNYIGIVISLGAAALSLLNNFNINNIRNKKYRETKPFERKGDYIKRVFYLSNYAKEIRIYNLHNKLVDTYKETSSGIKKTILKYSNKICFLTFLSNYILNDFVFYSVFIIILLHQAVVQKSITYGSFATMYYATAQLKDTLLYLSTVFAKYQSNSLYIEYFKRFISYQPQILQKQNSESPSNIPSDIEIKDVDFRYHNKQDNIINDINLKITPGEKVAIIGYNGSGKTTLIKLLLRLYDVTKGTVLLNNTNIKEYQILPYRNLFGVVFQDFQVYATSIANNIAMSMNTGAEERQESIQKALEQSGISKVVSHFPMGIDTAVTKEFETNGKLFSGGEEQKLAISRIFFKDSNYIVLDEPSSALDPIAEYNLNHTIKTALKDKTIIFITHRLSTARIADKIYMMEAGKIIEEGSHEILMDLKGKYAEMFYAQANKYM